MTRHPIGRRIATLLAVWMVTACSSSSNRKPSLTTNAAPRTDQPLAVATFDLATLKPCEVLTKAEIEAAVGEAVSVDDSISGECWWSSRTNLKTVAFKVSSAPDTLEGLHERRNGFENTAWSTIDLGTEGFQGKLIPSVDWLIGAFNVELNIAWSTNGDPYPIAEKLARLADNRIIQPK
jgi:hypothetical protein